MTLNKRDAIYSRVSSKSQTVLPKQILEALQIAPGDTLRYRITDQGVVIDKMVVLPDGHQPFATFTVWAGAADDEAYGAL